MRTKQWVILCRVQSAGGSSASRILILMVWKGNRIYEYNAAQPRVITVTEQMLQIVTMTVNISHQSLQREVNILA